MSLYREPPETITIDGVLYPVDTDFRRWIEFQGILLAKEEDGRKAERLCEFMTSLGLPPSNDTLESMLEFYSAASQEKSALGKKHPQAFDFEQDSEFIFSAFWECYGIDLSTAKLHWWRFKALFKSLPQDCEICRIMAYRTVDLKDVPKQQKQFYREMKSRYSLGTGNTGYKTEQDMKDYVKRRYEEAQAHLSVLRSSGQSGDAGSESTSK